jgi:hypothetical protein
MASPRARHDTLRPENPRAAAALSGGTGDRLFAFHRYLAKGHDIRAAP